MFKWWWCGYITVKQIKSNKFILYLPSLSLGNEVQNSLEGCAAIFFADASIKKVLIKRREMLLLWWPLGSHISKKYPLEILLNLSKGQSCIAVQNWIEVLNSIQFFPLNLVVNSSSVHWSKTVLELLLNSPLNFFELSSKSIQREWSAIY